LIYKELAQVSTSAICHTTINLSLAGNSRSAHIPSLSVTLPDRDPNHLRSCGEGVVQIVNRSFRTRSGSCQRVPVPAPAVDRRRSTSYTSFRCRRDRRHSVQFSLSVFIHSGGKYLGAESFIPSEHELRAFEALRELREDFLLGGDALGDERALKRT